MTYAQWLALTWIWHRPEWQQLSIEGQTMMRKLERQERRFERLYFLWWRLHPLKWRTCHAPDVQVQHAV